MYHIKRRGESALENRVRVMSMCSHPRGEEPLLRYYDRLLRILG